MIFRYNKIYGFTLIELLVVIAIIGILSTIATVAIGNARAKARDAVRRNDMNQLGTAMQMYYGENNSNYPAAGGVGTCGNDGVIAEAVNGPICGGSLLEDAGGEVYFQRLPTDPTNTSPQPSYYYDDGSDANTYCIQVNLETTADADLDDWFICRDGACFPSLSNCDNDVGS